MKIDKAGLPFIAGAMVPAAALAGARKYGWATGFAALGAFFAGMGDGAKACVAAKHRSSPL